MSIHDLVVDERIDVMPPRDYAIMVGLQIKLAGAYRPGMTWEDAQQWAEAHPEALIYMSRHDIIKQDAIWMAEMNNRLYAGEREMAMNRAMMAMRIGAVSVRKHEGD